MDRITDTASLAYEFLIQNLSVKTASSTLAILAAMSIWNESHQRTRPAQNARSLKKGRIPDNYRERIQLLSPRLWQLLSPSSANGISKRRKPARSKLTRNVSASQPVPGNGQVRFTESAKYRAVDRRTGKTIPCSEVRHNIDESKRRKPVVRHRSTRSYKLDLENPRYAKFLAAVTKALKQYIGGDLNPSRCGNLAEGLKKSTRAIVTPRLESPVSTPDCSRPAYFYPKSPFPGWKKCSTPEFAPESAPGPFDGWRDVDGAYQFYQPADAFKPLFGDVKVNSPIHTAAPQSSLFPTYPGHSESDRAELSKSWAATEHIPITCTYPLLPQWKSDLTVPASLQNPSFTGWRQPTGLSSLSSSVPSRAGRGESNMSAKVKSPDISPTKPKQPHPSPSSAKKPFSSGTVPSRAVRDGPWTRARTRASLSGTSTLAPTPAPPTLSRRRSRLCRNTGGLDSIPIPIPEYPNASNTLQGGLAPGDELASARLKAKLSPNNNETICDADIPTRNAHHPWGLVNHDQLLELIPWSDAELMKYFISEDFYTTFNVVALMLQSLATEVRSDEEIYHTLLGFGSEMYYPYIDVEYMHPINPPKEWTDIQFEYWTALMQYKQQALQGLGVIKLDDGPFYTAGEDYFDTKGWTAEMPGQVAENEKEEAAEKEKEGKKKPKKGKRKWRGKRNGNRKGKEKQSEVEQEEENSEWIFAGPVQEETNGKEKERELKPEEIKWTCEGMGRGLGVQEQEPGWACLEMDRDRRLQGNNWMQWDDDHEEEDEERGLKGINPWGYCSAL